MMQDFLKKNKSTFSLIAAFVAGWLIISLLKKEDSNIDAAPSKGQIYVLAEEGTYAVMLLDSLDDNQLLFYNYDGQFKGAIPTLSAIKEGVFITDFYAIYEEQEIERLKTTGRIVKIYQSSD